MSVVTVSSVSGFQAALAAAHSGDTIQLAAGNYVGIYISGVNNAGNITITSADPNNEAVLGSLYISQSSGLTFTGLTLNNNAADFPGMDPTLAADPYPFRVTNSDRINLTNLDIHGSLDNNPANDRNALVLENSTHLNVTHNEIHETGLGIVISQGDFINVTDNYIHDIRQDAIHASSSDTLVANNFITNQKPGVGDHTDIVQWFSESATVSPHDVTITNNAYIRGSGQSAEGIFIANQAGYDPALYNFSITDNILIGASNVGIMMQHGINTNISNNLLYSYADYNARIWLGTSVNVTDNNNVAWFFIYGTSDNVNFDYHNTNTNITSLNNVNNQTAVTPDQGAALLSAWLMAHPNFTANTMGSAATGTQTVAAPPPPPPPVVVAPPPPPPPVVVSPPPPPSTPGGLNLDGSTDTGTVGDTITKSSVVRIDGVRSDAGSTVKILSDGVTVGTGTADASGNFSVLTTVGLSDGTHTIKAVTQSTSGAVSSVSEGINVTVDTHGPVSDVIDFTLLRNAKNETVGLSGAASDDSGAAVKVALYRDGTLVQQASANGAWHFDDTTSLAVHTYTVKATDVAGNVANADHSVVIGTSNAETVRGGAGADLIWGAGGYDTMTGGAGADTFYFRSAADAPMPTFMKNGRLQNIESITDFTDGVDKIDLSDIGQLAYGGQSQSAHVKSVDWYVSGNNTFVMADTSGDGRADMMIQLTGVHHLTASDFLLG